MKTLVEMKNKVIELYREGMFDYLQKPDFDDLDGDEDLELLTYMTDEILLMPEEEQDDFIALLSLYYYITTISCISSEAEFSDLLNINSPFCDKVIRTMIGKSKEEYIERVKDQENELLDDLVTFIIEEDIYMYTYKELENGITEFDCWYKVEQVLKDKRHQNIYKKFHPDILAEAKEYKKYYDNEQSLKKMTSLKLNSVGEFISVFLQARQIFSNEDYVRYFLFQYIRKANEERSPSLPQIMTFILKYYYVNDYLNNPSRLDKTTREIAYALEDLEFNTTSKFSNFLNKFLDFDLVKYSNDFSSLPPHAIAELNELVNMDNRKTYENEGIWVKRNVQEDLISLIEETYIHCPEWENYLISAKKEELDTYIYYSKDKNGNYSIPRILLTSNKEKSIEHLVGRYENGNLEFSMIPTVIEKAQEFSNRDRIVDNMNFLDILRKIDNKIESQEELTDIDIRILYNLTPDSNQFYQEFDDYIDIIRRKDNAKKTLSRYFGCREDQVATNMEEINKDTMVTTEFMALKSIMEPTNIRVIIGNAECSALQDARCLSELEYITGSATFSLLKSSKGLEKLVFIGKDADFRKLEDPNNLNPNLFIGGTTKFKDNKKPKTYGNKN